MLGNVAIVGRPNVGKSTLFNRIIGERLSITDDRAGVTRDRIYSTGEWLGHKFNLIDTGGIDIVDAPFLEEIRAQAEIAIEEAEVIIFVVDIRTGVTDTDTFIARILQKTKKKVILAVNRVDDNKWIDNIPPRGPRPARAAGRRAPRPHRAHRPPPPDPATRRRAR